MLWDGKPRSLEQGISHTAISSRKKSFTSDHLLITTTIIILGLSKWTEVLGENLPFYNKKKDSSGEAHNIFQSSTVARILSPPLPSSLLSIYGLFFLSSAQLCIFLHGFPPLHSLLHCSLEQFDIRTERSILQLYHSISGCCPT